MLLNLSFQSFALIVALLSFQTSANYCYADNCLRALRGYGSSGEQFCYDFMSVSPVTTVVTTVPPHLSPCPSRKMSSACSCVSLTVSTTSTRPSPISSLTMTWTTLISSSKFRSPSTASTKTSSRSSSASGSQSSTSKATTSAGSSSKRTSSSPTSRSITSSNFSATSSASSMPTKTSSFSSSSSSTAKPSSTSSSRSGTSSPTKSSSTSSRGSTTSNLSSSSKSSTTASASSSRSTLSSSTRTSSQRTTSTSSYKTSTTSASKTTLSLDPASVFSVTASPTSCYQLPTPLVSLTPYSDPSFTAPGLDSPFILYTDSNGIPVPQIGITAGGASGILDLSNTNSLAFTSSNGTMIIDNAGIHVQTADCKYQVDVSMATLTALNKTAPTKRSTDLSIRDVLVPPVLFTVVLQIYDACVNIIPELQPLPVVTLNGTACSALVPSGNGFYKYDCNYIFGQEKQCEPNALEKLGELGISDYWAIFAADLSFVLLLLASVAAIAGVTEFILAATVWTAIGGGFAVLANTATVWSFILGFVIQNKDAIAAGMCQKKYGIDPPQPLKIFATTNTATEFFALDQLTTAPTTTLQNFAPELDYKVILQTEAGTFSPPVAGDLLQNGNFDYGACTAVVSISPWTAYFVYPDTTVQRMWFGTGGTDGNAGCSTGIHGDNCVTMAANTVAKASCPTSQVCNYYSEHEQYPVAGIVSGITYTVTVWAKLLEISGPVVLSDPAAACTLTAHIGNVLANTFPIASLYAPDTVWQKYTLSLPVTNLENGVPSDPLNLFWLRFQCGDGIAGLVMVDQISLVAT